MERDTASGPVTGDVFDEIRAACADVACLGGQNMHVGPGMDLDPQVASLDIH